MIVGLGNPGRTYEDTRHNAGFMVLDRLAARWGAVFKADRQRKCEVAAGPGVLLVKPSTFMNESGLCVGPMMRFFKLDPRSVFVIHDEVDFPLGVIKLREKGSAGGHNGIKSLIAHMGTQEFPRLRFGIGQPRGKGEMIGHVLGKFRPEERELLDVTLGKAEDAVLYTMEHGITRAGNIFNAVPQYAENFLSANHLLDSVGFLSGARRRPGILRGRACLLFSPARHVRYC